MSCGWTDPLGCIEEHVIDPLIDAAEDAADWAEDNVIDPLVDAAEDAADWFEDNIFDPATDTLEDIGDWIEDVAEDIANEIENTWDNITDFTEDLWDDIVENIDNVFDTIVEGMEDAWEWLEDSVQDAVDWLVEAAETVYEFIVEEAIPYIITIIEAIPVLIKVLGSLLILPLCYLFKEIFGDEEATILEGIANHEPRILEEFTIERIRVNKKFVVFSDVHMFIDNDLDFFKKNKNKDIYEFALKHYAQNNYHLIENGDIEDFWMRGFSAKALILLTSEQLPYPYFSEPFEQSSFRSANQIHALNIFVNNATTYATIRSNFQSNGMYTRLIGNHDDVWADSEMDHIMDMLYPGLQINDYCTLESNNGQTKVILSHGHNSDIFNMPMCNFAGKSMTDLASIIHELSFGEWNLFSKSKQDWMALWTDMGFDNELQEIDLLDFVSFSEYDLYKGIEGIYGNSLNQPYIILGHTHSPKDDAGVPNFMFHDEWNWGEYSNSGTVGMWEEIVFGLEVEYPSVTVVAWKKEPNGTIKKYNLRSYNYGDTYLRA